MAEVTLDVESYVKKLKDEIKNLTVEKGNLEASLEDMRRKGNEILQNAERDAKAILEKAQSEIASLNAALSEREKSVSKAEQILDRQKEDAKHLASELDSVNSAKASLESEKQAFEAEKAMVSEREDHAKLMLEQANALAADKGVILETPEPEKEEKEEKKKKKKE